MALTAAYLCTLQIYGYSGKQGMLSALFGPQRGKLDKFALPVARPIPKPCCQHAYSTLHPQHQQATRRPMSSSTLKTSCGDCLIELRSVSLSMYSNASDKTP